jgi:hypothetical protein
MTVYKWSQTAASNATADGTINWAEGQAPSSVNDSARAEMAAVAKYRDDQAGTLTTGGSSTAYTLTTNQVFSSLSAMSGSSLRVKFNATNGASPTLNVDGLGAKAIVSVTGTAVLTGAIVANTVHDLVYSNSSSEWILVGQSIGNLIAPSQTAMLFHQTSAPVGWTKRVDLHDYALRLTSGTVSFGGSTVFSAIFASRTILQANLPNVNFTVAASGTVTPTVSGGSSASAVVTGSGPLLCATGTGTNFYGAASFGTMDQKTVNTTGTAASGGSGTAMDFAVAYIDVILAYKD